MGKEGGKLAGHGETKGKTIKFVPLPKVETKVPLFGPWENKQTWESEFRGVSRMDPYKRESARRYPFGLLGINVLVLASASVKHQLLGNKLDFFSLRGAVM